MKRIGLFVFLLSSISLAHAQVPTDAIAPLSKEEVVPLLQGAKVDFTSKRGNQLSWKNELDGTMFASSVGSGRGTTTRGTWKIDDKGRFCVVIDWPSSHEEWCRYVIKDGDNYYITSSKGQRISKLTVTR